MPARMLAAIVNREIHPMRCASTCGRKALKALVLGDLCKEAHHPMWARRILMFGLELIHNKDYDDWVGEWFNTRYVCMQDVISNGICEIIGRRIDEIDRLCGLNEPKGLNSWEYWAGDGWYDGFRYEKFDYDWTEQRKEYIAMRDEAVKTQNTMRMFRDGQGELPPQSQDFFHFWEDFDPLEEDLNFKIDDWD